jgi:hypothetical protein
MTDHERADPDLCGGDHPVTVRASLFFLPELRRRAIRFPQPVVQLKLPVYLLILTLAFGALFAWHSNAAYESLYGLVISSMPDSYRVTLQEQTHDFAIVSAMILAGYALFVLGFCVAYTHGLLGPLVALRRHIQALKGGQYGSRVELRKSDTAYLEMAQDLNDLAQSLAGGRKR